MSLSDLIRSAIILLLLVTNSCGFRLQGVGDMPESLATTYIDTEDRYTVFYRQLSAQLEQSGVVVVDSPVHANAIIRLDKDESSQRVLTVSGRNVPTEFNIYYNIGYSVWVNGEEALAEQSLGLTQAYTYDPATVLGKNREQDAIREALAQNLVRQVTRQLSLL